MADGWGNVGEVDVRIVSTRRAPIDAPDGINVFIFSLASELLAAGNEVFAVPTTLSWALRALSPRRLARTPLAAALEHRIGWHLYVEAVK